MLVVDGFGASETGGQGQIGRRRRAATIPSRAALPRRTTRRPCSTTTSRPGRAGRRRQARPARPHPARLLQGPGEDRGDVPRGRRRALVGARRPRAHRGRRHDHRARARLGVDQHRRREGVPRRGRGGAEGARRRVRRGRRRRARRALGRARRRGRAAARRARTPTLDDARRARPRARSPATRCRATLVLVDAIVRSPSGKPDYRWARATAVAAAGTP